MLFRHNAERNKRVLNSFSGLVSMSNSIAFSRNNKQRKSRLPFTSSTHMTQRLSS